MYNNNININIWKWKKSTTEFQCAQFLAVIQDPVHSYEQFCKITKNAITFNCDLDFLEKNCSLKGINKDWKTATCIIFTQFLNVLPSHLLEIKKQSKYQNRKLRITSIQNKIYRTTNCRENIVLFSCDVFIENLLNI